MFAIMTNVGQSLTDADASKVTDETSTKPHNDQCLTDADASRGTEETCSLFNAIMGNNAGDDPLCSYSLTDADAGKGTDETCSTP